MGTILVTDTRQYILDKVLETSSRFSNMLNPSTFLFVLIAAGSAILLSAVPFQDTECLTGFWCRKRTLGSSGKECPTGFWCKRSANDNEGKSMCEVGFWCK